jgi:hypothetical protein
MSFWRNDPVIGGAPAASESRGTRGPVRIPDPEGDARRAAEQAAREAEQRRQERAIDIQEGRFQADMADRDRRLDVGPAATASEGERKSGGFYGRAMQAERNFANIDFDPTEPGQQSVQGRGLVGQFVQDTSPNFLNSLPAGIGNSRERQLADQAERAFIAAVLRYDSGAAIPPDEFVQQGRIYFPRPGDSPEVLEQKARDRQMAIAGLRSAAGVMAGLAEEEFARLNAQQDGAANPAAPRAAEDGYRFEVANAAQGDVTGRRLPQGAQAAYGQFLASLDPAAPVEANARAILGWWQQNGNGLTLPPDNAIEIAQARANGQIISGIDYSLSDAARIAELEGRAAMEGLRAPGSGGIGQSVDAAVRGAADVPTLGFADEIAAAGDTLFRGGTMADNLDYQRYIDRRDEQFNPYARLAGQVAGGFALPFGRFGTGARGMAKEGAAFGAGYGFGSGEGDFTDRLATAGAGAAAGGVIGGGLGAAVQRGAPAVGRFLDGRRAQQAERQAFADAAERQGIDYMAADIPGATGSQLATGITNMTVGTLPLTAAAERAVGTVQTARDRAAAGIGSIGADAADAGNAARRGMANWRERSQGRVTDLYAAIPVEPTSDATLSSTRRALTELDSRFSSNPQLAAAMRDPRISRWREALSGDNRLSWEDLQAFRTDIGELIEGAVMSESGGGQRLRRLYAALSEDMEATAAAAGPRALTAFRRANAYARGRFNRIEQIMTPLFGNADNRADEAAFRTLNNWASEGASADHVKLARALRTMPADEANSIRATIVSRLGRPSAGRRDGEGEGFSPADFVTQWNNLGDRAKSLLFQGEHRAALDDIARVAAGMKASTRYENYSRTGIGVAALGNLFTASLSLLTTGASMGAQYGAGALLGNARFSRWLAGAGKKPNPAAARAHIDRLPAIARSEPLIAADVLSLQQRLLEAFNAAPSRMAAEENDNESNGVESRD